MLIEFRTKPGAFGAEWVVPDEGGATIWRMARGKGPAGGGTVE